MHITRLKNVDNIYVSTNVLQSKSKHSTLTPYSCRECIVHSYRRNVIIGIPLTITQLCNSQNSLADGEQPAPFVYTDKAKQIQFQPPPGWKQSKKSGAEVLFNDPTASSFTLGLTADLLKKGAPIVNFFSLQQVVEGEQKLASSKEGFYASEVLQAEQFDLAPDVPAYLTDIYIDNTARGLKRTISLQFVVGNIFYTLNLSFKCNKKFNCQSELENSKIELVKDVYKTVVILDKNK